MNLLRNIFLPLCLSAYLSFPASAQVAAAPQQAANQDLGRTSAQSPWYAEDYEFITNDGAWCWFSDPRAIYVDGKAFGGYVDRQGSIWAFSYDPASGEKQQSKVYDKLQYDDHANPSFLALPDKRIAIFFSAHNPSPLYYTTTKNPCDISSWEPVQAVRPKVGGDKGLCYTNPMTLSAEKGKLFLFFRGPNFKPCYITSTDLKTWSDPITVVDKRPGPEQAGRPYAKYASNGKDKIFIAFTDGHPRNEPTNSIYCLMYRKGKFCKVGGEVVCDASTSAFSDQADLVYDARETFDKAWIWDIAVGRDGNPVIVYARFSDEFDIHSYWYALWNGKSWENHKITDAGQWFMRNNYNNKDIIETEGNYSGGVYLDHNDPTIVYTSRPIKNVFEIERWTFDAAAAKASAKKGGDTKSLKLWTVEPVTSESLRDNVRPFVIRDYPAGVPNLLWMYNYSYTHYTKFVSAIKIDAPFKGYDKSVTKTAIDAVASKVFSWQVADLAERPLPSADARDWRAGTLYRGMFDWAALKDRPEMFTPLRRIFDREYWQLHNRMTFADGLCVGQAYLDMYERFREEKMLVPTKARFDWIVDHPLPENIDNAKGPSERWWWCDALYMAPSVFSRLWRITGDEKYIEYAHREFLATYEQLFDKEEDLFYRDSDFIPMREANGEKVFWSRGNGWVMAGLMEMLKTLPADDAKYRPFYEDLFRTMSKRIAGLQSPTGFWRSSLLDQVTYTQPETSGTAMYVAALAYGINSGLLSREDYLETVTNGWKALVSSVNVDGRLGWVQPVGGAPQKIKRKDNELYGTGAFLMAAAQLHALATD